MDGDKQNLKVFINYTITVSNQTEGAGKIINKKMQYNLFCHTGRLLNLKVTGSNTRTTSTWAFETNVVIALTLGFIAHMISKNKTV